MERTLGATVLTELLSISVSCADVMDANHFSSERSFNIDEMGIFTSAKKVLAKIANYKTWRTTKTITVEIFTSVSGQFIPLMYIVVLATAPKK